MACLPVTPNTSPQLTTPSRPQTTPNSPNPTPKQFPKLTNKDNTSVHHHISLLCKNGRIREAVESLSQLQSNNVHVGPDIYGELLQGCVYTRALGLGLQIHGHVIKKGPTLSTNEFVESKLVILYAKCGASDVAIRLFRNVRNQNLFSWAAIVGLQARTGRCEEALLSYVEMLENGFGPDNFVVPNALKACGALRWVRFGKGVHGYVVKMMGFDGCVYVATSLADMYGKCGVLKDAERVFDEIPEKNVVAWNSMIAVYALNGMNEEAVRLFQNMRFQGFEPSQVTLSSFLSACANLEAIKEGRQGHALAVLMGLDLGNILGSAIMNFYSKVGLIEEVELVFRDMVMKDEVTWNLIISNYVQFGMFERALEMCHLMMEEELRFDCVTLSSILAVAADTGDLGLGKKAHGFCIKNEFDSDVVVLSGVVDMYAKCGRIDCATRVFSFAAKKDIVLWNTMLAACAEKGLSGEALRLFFRMQLESVPPNVVSWNSVIFGLFRNGKVVEAQNMFSEMHSSGVKPNLITWTTVISGLAQNGLGYDAIMVFPQMQDAGIRPNSVSITSALSACTELALLKYGREIHGYVMRHYTSLSPQITTSIIDMYAKCGNVEDSEEVFYEQLEPNEAIFNAMICGYAHHGKAQEAIEVFGKLEKKGVTPNHVTFLAVLSACSHAGYVEDTLYLFTLMLDKYKIKPKSEHYSCLVDAYGRAGRLEEAYQIVQKDGSESAWRTLLGACRNHNNTEIGEKSAMKMIELNPSDHAPYILLSNIYIGEGKWEEALKCREKMAKIRVKKDPGSSWLI